MTRIIVCGGRDYPHMDRVFAALDHLHAKRVVTMVVHGACQDRQGEFQGADRWADDWALARGVKVERHPAQWERFGRRAGPLRNRDMARAGAAGLVAFPGGSGTADMVRQARAVGIPVWIPYGGVEEIQPTKGTDR